MAEDQLRRIETRLTALEEWRQDRTVADAVRKEQAKHVDARFDALEKKVDAGFTRQENLVGRIVWLVVSTLLVGVIGFIMKGGLNGFGG